MNVQDWIASLELEVGQGENHFTMEKGSFSYKQKLSGRRSLRMIGREEQAEGSVLVYLDGTTGDKYRLLVHETDNGADLAMTGPVPAGVNRFWLSFATDDGEHIYGCGETYSELDLKGQKVRIWVAEHQNARRIARKILREKLLGRHPKHTLRFSAYESYYAQPTFTSSGRYFVHVDTSAYAEFDFTRPARTTLYLQEPPKLFLRQAEDFETLSGMLSELLGHQGLLPDWTYDGGIMAIQGGTEVVDEKIHRALEAGVLLKGVWCQDWCGCRRTGFGYQVMWNWQYDAVLYHDLPEMIAKWKQLGVRFLGYINPFMAIEKNIYAEASAKGYTVKNAAGEDYLVTITTFPAAMIDLTNPEAWDWYKALIKRNILDIGISGYMADFGEYLPTDCVLYSGEDPALVHNRWPAMWAQLNREVLEEAGMLEEVFFFTRAGHTGTVAASTMMWTGDQHVDWSVDDGLPSVIPATLSLAMSGYGMAHSDVGGYTTIQHMCRSRELLLRWEEMNVFTPMYRSHEGNQPVKNVQFADDAGLLEHLARCTRQHAALKPLLQALVLENAQKGVPVMRPLFYHYDEPRAYTEKTEYLLGRDILVAPVIEEKATTRSCWLPADSWVHLHSGTEYGGGEVTVEAPIGAVPVFVRKGSPWYALAMSLAQL